LKRGCRLERWGEGMRRVEERKIWRWGWYAREVAAGLHVAGEYLFICGG
jgi:hypothetical protein